MRFFLNFSIKNKLIGMILLVSVLAVGIGFTFVIINNIKTFKKNMVNNTFVNAGLIGEYCVTPIAFQDKEGAAEILQKLNTIPSIMTGYVYDKNGNLFAAYDRSADEILPHRLDEKPAAEFEGKYLHVVQPIIYQNQMYGTVYLRASTAVLDNKIKNLLITMTGLMLGLVLFSYFLAHRLQKVLSDPILKLASVTKKISEKGNLSVRVEREGNDEIRTLYDGFNEMMDQIQTGKEERDKTELALRESEEKFRKLFESSNDAMMLLDENEFLDCNNAALRVFRCAAREELLGKHPGDVSPSEQADGRESRLAADERMTEAFREGTSFFEWTYRRISGEDFPAEVLMTSMKIEGRKVIQATVRDITARKLAEEQIKASLKEKELLLQEIHHRVKNNMQLISSLISLQSRCIEDKQTLEIFKSSQNRIRSMALIHERLYQSKEFARVNFVEYVQSLTKHLLSSYGISPDVIKLYIDIKDVFLDVNTAIPCSLIINELVSNSLKHAFQDRKKGKIKIAMQPINEDEIELIVSDDGVGLPEEVNLRKTESLGLHLVTLLAEDQLHGDIKLDRKTGTRFHIRFGEKKEKTDLNTGKKTLKRVKKLST